MVGAYPRGLRKRTEGGTVEQAVFVALRKIRTNRSLWKSRFFARQPSWPKTEPESSTVAAFSPTSIQPKLGSFGSCFLLQPRPRHFGDGDCGEPEAWSQPNRTTVDLSRDGSVGSRDFQGEPSWRNSEMGLLPGFGERPSATTWYNFRQMKLSKLLLNHGLAVSLGCVALTAQTAQHKQSGELVMSNGQSKQILFFAATAQRYEADLDGQAMRYSEDLAEVFQANQEYKTSRLPEISLKGLARLDLLPFSKADQAVIAATPGLGGMCGATQKSCHIRKVSLTFSDGKKRDNLFLLLDPVLWAVGPENRQYYLGDYDISAVVIRR